MCNPCAEEYQNNTVSQIAERISRMRKRLKPGSPSSRPSPAIVSERAWGRGSWAEPDFRYLRREVGIHSNTQLELVLAYA